MPEFVYRAKSGPSKTVQGQISASSRQKAIDTLIASGHFIISIKEIPKLDYKRPRVSSRHIPSKHILGFMFKLSTLLDSRVNIIEALGVIAKQERNKNLKNILTLISQDIQKGKSLSEGLSNFPDIFGYLYVSLIRSGERAGNLEIMLKNLASFLEKEEEFKNALRQALIYPVFLFSISALTVALIIRYVIPRLVKIFEDVGRILPLATRILINVSSFLQHYWWIIVTALVLFIYLWRISARYPKVKIFLDRYKLKTILIGPLVLKTEISRFFRTLSLLLSGGVPIVEALGISAEVVDNSLIKDDIILAKQEVSRGVNLSDALGASKFFSLFVTSIVNVGEKIGSLESTLLRVSQEYDKDVERVLRVITRLFEPAVILLVGLVVGFIVISMLLPIFQINIVVQ